MTGTAVQTGYAPVNGLRMYYEILGAGDPPLVVLHGAYGTIESSRVLVPALAATRRVVVPEQQGHGRTADVDRPLSYEQMADDTVALLRYLGIARADLFGYSMGGRTALQFAVQHPDLVRKLVLVAASYDKTGLYHEALAAVEGLTPELLASTPIEAAYRQFAPDPEGFPSLVAKLKQLDLGFAGFRPEGVAAIAAPTLIVAESYANRLTAFDIAADGGLSNRRSWADLGEGVADGICLDADGAVWYGDPGANRCVRVREGGAVLQTIELDRGCFACMLGDADRRTLFLMANELPDLANPAGDAARTGQILTVAAPAPGTGWP